MNNLNLLGPVNFLSYGIVTKNILKNLELLKCNVALFPIGPVYLEQHEQELVQKAIDRCPMLDYKAPSLRIYHEHDLSIHAGQGKKIGFPIFEMDQFTNELHLNHLSNQDRLFVTSQWGKSVLEGSNVRVPISVIPLGVDRTIFNDALTARVPTHKSTIFFHCGKIEIRKGHSFLAECFSKAFEKTDDVELWISWNNHFMKPEEIGEWITFYKNTKLGDKIKFLPWVQSQAEMAQIMSKTDVGVWPSLAEGWGMPCLEYMSLGKPVIATNYSAPTEYLTKENAFLIDIDEKEKAFDGKWFLGYGQWAKYDKKQKDQLVYYMRELHKKKQEGGSLQNDIGIETATKFTWLETAKKIIREVNE